MTKLSQIQQRCLQCVRAHRAVSWNQLRVDFTANTILSLQIKGYVEPMGTMVVLTDKGEAVMAAMLLGTRTN